MSAAQGVTGHDFDTPPPTCAYRVEIQRHDAARLWRPVLYEVRTRGSDGELVVWHRYSDFKELEGHLRSRFPGLPSLPERSSLQKLIDTSVVIATRKQMLGKFLQAATLLDPTLDDVQLRNFLGVVRKQDDSRLLPDLSKAAVHEDLNMLPVRRLHTQSWTPDSEENAI